VAIENLWYRHSGESIQPWELSEEKQADLYQLDIEQDGLIDIVSSEGVVGLGLPVQYPTGVSREVTQSVGQHLYDEARPGIWCKSAALPENGQEVALFTDRSNSPRAVRGPERLWEWFPVPSEEGRP